MSEIKFQKYKTRGAGYHWEQVGRSLKKRNVFVVARYKLVVNLLQNDIKNKKVLDVGCGDGVLSYFLAQKGGLVTGIDLAEEAINFAKTRCRNIPSLKFEIASVYNLPFENKSFDYIVCSEVIEHLKEPERMLKEIKRVWNKKGKIIITTPVRYTKYPLDRMHYQEFFEEDFKKILENIFENYQIRIIKSHPLFWSELQNKVLFGHSLFKLILNFLNLIFGWNPFLFRKNWKFYTLQSAIISKVLKNDK